MVEQIKFDSPNPDILVWKWPSEEIKLGAQVIVNPSQEAIFVKGGTALDIFGAGTHTLSTGNLPLLGKLVKWVFGKQTPFTAEIWFINKTIRRGLKWGTKSPIQVIDPEYNYPISVRAFGEWGLRINDVQSFVNQIVGTQIGADTDLIEEYFGGEIVQKVSNLLSECIISNKTSVFQINSKLNILSETIQEQIATEFERFGIEIVNFNIERISIPEEENKKFQDILGKKMELTQLGDVNVSQAYMAVKSFEAINKAAENPSNNPMATLLGAGIGLGAGLPLGKQFADSVNTTTKEDPMQKLQKLKQLLDAGLITQNEFDSKKQEILSSL
ncbi:MAG: SPFH domain-containing protein [Alphaproteobacteria bacterium]|nr:SPFH domain-containing protein [Alphaproteobacteria bacterium]